MDIRFKDLANSISSFRTGDVIPVDGPEGTVKMPKDDLLKETAQNALGSVEFLATTERINDLESQTRFLVHKLEGFTIMGTGLWGSSSSYDSAVSKVTPSSKVIISPISSAYPAYYAVLKSFDFNPVNGTAPDYATGFTGYKKLEKSTEVTIPSDGNYLVWLLRSGADSYAPMSIVYNGFELLQSIQTQMQQKQVYFEWADEQKNFFAKAENLFDIASEGVVHGKYIINDTMYSDSNYNVSDYIQVKDYVTYTLKTYSYFGTNRDRISCYDSTKSYLGVSYGTLSDNTYLTVKPLPGTAFVRINHKVNDYTLMLVAGSEYPASYIPFGNKPSHLIISSLYGKKLCCDGDSIMIGAHEGGMSNGGFAKQIALKYRMNLQNLAVAGGTIRSGTTWDEGGNRHWICDSIENLDADGDYYLFEGGVNDVNSVTVMGNVTYGYTSTLDTTTFCGAMEKCCKTLAENFDGKKLGFVFVHRIWNPNDTLANSFFENQKIILKKWGIPFIDLMNEIPSLNLIESLKTEYTVNGDGWHPNTTGYSKYYVDKIASFLERL